MCPRPYARYAPDSETRINFRSTQTHIPHRSKNAGSGERARASMTSIKLYCILIELCTYNMTKRGAIVGGTILYRYVIVT